MDIIIWKEIIKKLEKMKNGDYNPKLNKISTNKEGTGYLIKRKEVCKHCKVAKFMFVKIMFEKSQRLSIFDLELITTVFMLCKKPFSYVNTFPKSVMGKKFIENIKNIEKVNC